MAEPLQNPSDIGIVTAFFDIGRGDWTPERDFPAYLHRTTETYLTRFGIMASLENEMVIYTSEDLVPRVAELRKGKEDRTTIIPLPFKEMFPEKRAAITRIQNDPAFKGQINPAKIKSPEYWSPDYVLVTNLKAFFVLHAVENNFIKAPQAAWMDFGYCRDVAALGGSKLWQYDFTPGKIHLFFMADYKGEVPIDTIVAHNLVFVAGACVVASKEMWRAFAQLVNKAAEDLMTHNLVDDDQTLFLMASIYRPELFEQHKISDADWQPVLRLFNKNAISG